MFYISLVRSKKLQRVQTHLALLFLQFDTVNQIFCHFKLLFKGCLNLTILFVSFGHQLFLPEKSRITNLIFPILLQLFEAIQFRLNAIHQFLVFTGNVIILSSKVIKSFFLRLQLLLQNRFFIAPTDYCINTYTSIIFFLFLAGLDSVIHHTQLLVQGRFLSLELLHHLSKKLILTLSFAIQFREILLNQWNTLTRISYRIIKFTTQFFNLLFLIQ